MTRSKGGGKREDGAAWERILPLLFQPETEVEPALERLDQLRQLGRVVLQVRVQRHDPLAAGQPEAGGQRRPPCRSCRGTRTPRTRGSAAESRSMTWSVPSREPSSM